MVRWSVSNPSRHPQRLRRPDSGQWPIANGRNEIRPRHDHLTPVPRRTGMPSDRPVCGGVADEVRPGVPPGQRLTGRRLGGVRLAENGVVGGHVGHLDPEHEPHRVQPGEERGTGAGLSGDPRGGPVVHDVERVLDVALGRQHQRLDGRPRGQTRQRLRGHRVQPRQPVGPCDGEDRAVRQVDDGQALLEEALLAQRVAVVGRDPRVEALGPNRSRRREQRRDHDVDRRGWHTGHGVASGCRPRCLS